jgi:septal ring factor EnvC (AmiA/AmiB activator)
METLAAPRLRRPAGAPRVIEALEQAAHQLQQHDKPAAEATLLAAAVEIDHLRAVLERTEAEFRESQLREIDQLFRLEAQLVEARAHCAALSDHIAAIAPGVAQLQAEVAGLDAQVDTLRRLTDGARDELLRVEATIAEMEKLRATLDVWWMRLLGHVLRGFGIIRSIPQLVAFLGDLGRRRARFEAAYRTYSDQLNGAWTERDQRRAALSPGQALLAELNAQKCQADQLILVLDATAAGLRADCADIRKRLRFFTDVRLFTVKAHHIIEQDARFIDQRIHHVPDIVHELDGAACRTVDFRNPNGPFIPLRQAVLQFHDFMQQGLIPRH